MTSRSHTSLAALGLLAFAGAAAAPACAAGGPATTTPIRHVVVIFQENVSFDHYFATYPSAANPAGEPAFHAAAGTPAVNGLASGGLLFHNPNSAQPFRLDRAQNYTCDQDHDYGPEQQAFDGGLMDRFVENTGVGAAGCPDYGHGKGLVMGYYDGNTVTALWNYAQRFAMSDNSFGTTFGPSTPGALNLISGQTGRVDLGHTLGDLTDSVIGASVIGDPDPFYDDCGRPAQVAMTGENIGDRLNAAGLTWGWFQGGFAPSSRDGSGKAICAAATPNLSGAAQTDYSAHHEPFQYYASTANPHHLPPTSVAMIGRTDQANHQYDLADFFSAAASGNLPAVSFLKAKRGQDGHAGYSSPLDEQVFLVQTINQLEKLPEWNDMAIFIAYDDSDGWYDHQMGPIVNSSASEADALSGAGVCGRARAIHLIQGRCGYGPRLPLLAISAWAKPNYVDHAVTDQSSVLRFIEDNWGLERIGAGSYDVLAGPLAGLFDFSHPRATPAQLDPATGKPQP
jgi:phospholipase C